MSTCDFFFVSLFRGGWNKVQENFCTCKMGPCFKDDNFEDKGHYMLIELIRIVLLGSLSVYLGNFFIILAPSWNSN